METAQQTERAAEQRFREVRHALMCHFWNVSGVVYLILKHDDELGIKDKNKKKHVDETQPLVQSPHESYGSSQLPSDWM